MGAKAQTKTPPEEAYVAHQVREVVEATGDSQEAAAMLLARMHEDDDLYQALGEPLLREGCKAAIRRHRTAARARHWTAVPQNDPATRLSVATRARINDLMAYPLSDGSRLGDADEAKLRGEAASYRTQAAELGRRARWYELIIPRLEAGKTVSQCLEARELDRLMDEAGRDGS